MSIYIFEQYFYNKLLPVYVQAIYFTCLYIFEQYLYNKLLPVYVQQSLHVLLHF